MLMDGTPRPRLRSFTTPYTLEVTGVGNGGYAYHITAVASQFNNLTCDGVCYFSNPYGKIQGFTIEGITAATVPSTTALQFNQVEGASNIAIINVPNAKCNLGVSVNGNTNIMELRFPDRGAGNQPNLPFYGGGGSGLISNVQMANCVTRVSGASLGNFLFVACSDITDANFTYSTNRAWTPTFTGWSVAPTINAARYSQTGRDFRLSGILSGGVATSGATLGGFPVPAAADEGSVGLLHASSDPTKSAMGSVLPGTSSLSGLPAIDLTGATWQLYISYRS